MAGFEGGPKVQEFIKIPETPEAKADREKLEAEVKVQASEKLANIKKNGDLEQQESREEAANLIKDGGNQTLNNGNEEQKTNQEKLDNVKAEIDDLKIQTDNVKAEIELAKSGKKIETKNTDYNIFSKKKGGFMENINSLLDNPIFAEFKSAMYNALAMLGSKESKNKYYILAQLSEVEKKLSRLDKDSEGKKITIEDRFGNKISYLSALRNIQPLLMQGEDGKEDDNMLRMKQFIGSSFDSQQIFLIHATKNPDNIKKYLGEDLKKPVVSSEAQNTNPETVETPNAKNVIKVKGLEKDPNQETYLEIKGEGDNQYISIGNIIAPIIDNKVTFYMGVDRGNRAGEKIISLDKDEKGNIILGNVKNGKSYPVDQNGILVDPNKDDLVQDNDKFNLWKSLALGFGGRKGSDILPDKQKESEAIFIKGMKELDNLPKYDRTPVILTQKIISIKNQLLSYIKEEEKNNFLKRPIDLVMRSQWS